MTKEIDGNIRVCDVEAMEQKEHDDVYRNSLPFDFKTYKIDPQHVIWWEDYCYKPGRRKDRGNRTKRVFELMKLDELKNKVILDVGCGNGQYSVFFAMMGAIVYAFDISPVGIYVGKRIAEANGVDERCHFSVQNASSTNYPDNYFDIVLFHEVLHHAIKYPNVHEETLRVVKKGGIVICADGIRENLIYNICRYIHRKSTKKYPRGDVDLSMKDLDDFSKGFSEKRIEFFSFLFKFKEAMGSFVHISIMRYFLHLLKKIDDVLLKALPSLNKYCGECIIVLQK
jgi:2-polyprenyl-3-methyl-5-hydroxy-6-metoxy-1,4-benzoquinol methylase